LFTAAWKICRGVFDFTVVRSQLQFRMSKKDKILEKV